MPFPISGAFGAAVELGEKIQRHKDHDGGNNCCQGQQGLNAEFNRLSQAVNSGDTGKADHILQKIEQQLGVNN